MMESQETKNLQAETSAPIDTSGSAQSIPREGTDREASEAKLNTSINAQEAQTELKSAPEAQDSSKASEQPEESINSSLNSEVDGEKKREDYEPSQEKETLPEKIEKTRMGVLAPENVRMRNSLADLYNLLSENYQASPSNTTWVFMEDVRQALTLIDCLESDKERTSKELEDQNEILRSLEDEKRKLEQNNRQWYEHCDSIKRELANITADRDNLSRTRQDFETIYKQQTQELARIQQENKVLERKLADAERSRDKLLAETASLKRNTGTHYEGTSDRPQHHVLIGEYKTLKEQHLDPLATSLFNFLATSNPELKQERKENLNDIKARISATVLIYGQAIIQRDSAASATLPLGTLEELQELFSQKLELDHHSFSPLTTELLKKEGSLARGEHQYPAPGQWKDEDFQQAFIELIDNLYKTLQLDATSLTEELKIEIQEGIPKALCFLERAALADPPVRLNLEIEGNPFHCDYHEAAKGWDDEGTVTKTIYPAYFVNEEAKVKAVVLTKASGPASPDALQSGTITNASDSTPLESKDINEDEKEKRIRLEAKRESLINSVEGKWSQNKRFWHKHSESGLIERLSKIEQIDIIEKLEKEIHNVSNQNQFEKKLDELLATCSQQDSEL